MGTEEMGTMVAEELAEEMVEGMDMVVAEETEVITVRMILVVVVMMDQILVTGVAEEE